MVSSGSTEEEEERDGVVVGRERLKKDLSIVGLGKREEERG